MMPVFLVAANERAYKLVMARLFTVEIPNEFVEIASEKTLI